VSTDHNWFWAAYLSDLPVPSPMHQKGDTERNGSGSQNNGYEVAVTTENIYENIGPRKPIDLGKRRA